MKLLYDHQIFIWQNQGGISRYFSELISRMCVYPELSVQISLQESKNLYFNSYNLHRNSIKLKGEKSLVYRKAEYKLKKAFKLNSINAYEKQTLDFLKNTPPDIFHPTYYSPYFINSVKKSKIAITIYDLIHEIFPEFYPNDPLTKQRSEILKKADIVFCISNKTRSDLLQFYDINPSKVFVTPLAASQPLELNLHECSTLKPQSPYFLYIGDRSKYKNFYFFCRVFSKFRKQFPEIKLITIGGGAFLKFEQDLLKELNFDSYDHVHVHSATDFELQTWFKNALGFIYPSLYEGFGLPILEALQAGCPVACSNTGSLPEVAGNAALFFDPKSAESMYQSFEKLASSSYRNQTFFDQSKEVLSHYNWNTTVQVTLQGYKSIL